MADFLYGLLIFAMAWAGSYLGARMGGRRERKLDRAENDRFIAQFKWVIDHD